MVRDVHEGIIVVLPASILGSEHDSFYAGPGGVNVYPHETKYKFAQLSH